MVDTILPFRARLLAATCPEALRNLGEKFFQQAVGQIHGASELCDLFSLPLQLLLNLCGACQLRVESFAQVVELIFNHGENIGRAIELPRGPRGPAGPRSPCGPRSRVRCAGILSEVYRVPFFSKKAEHRNHKRPADEVSDAARIMKIATTERWNDGVRAATLERHASRRKARAI